MTTKQIETQVQQTPPNEGDVGHEEFKAYGKYFRKGDKVRDQYGMTHEVMTHRGPSVTTYSGQSFHPTKIYHVA